MLRTESAAKVAATEGVAESVFFKLVRVVNLTARPFQEQVGRQHQLTLNEWRVLAQLMSHPGIPASEVADLTGLDKMAVSRAIGGLQQRGRLKREPDPLDQRRSRLLVSASGRKLFSTVAALSAQREAELFAALGTAELVRLSATLDKLVATVRGLGARDAHPQPKR